MHSTIKIHLLLSCICRSQAFTPSFLHQNSFRILSGRSIDKDDFTVDFASSENGSGPSNDDADLADEIPTHSSVASDAGPLWREALSDDPSMCTVIPHRGKYRKRVLVLCTGGTLTMQNDPTKGNSLAPVQGALTSYLAGMSELTADPEMPEIISHEYTPLIDSSDMGPGDWAMLARDIKTNYYHFDGFVVLMGTDTMACKCTAVIFA